MESRIFYVTNKFDFSDGRQVLAVANIKAIDIKSTKKWRLFINNLYCGEIKIVDILNFKGQIQRHSEMALVVTGELDGIDWANFQNAFIRSTVLESEIDEKLRDN